MAETVTTTTEQQRPTLAFVGAGRAGFALATALTDIGYTVRAVTSRTGEHARALAATCGAEVVADAVTAALAADITLLTVPDAEIPRVAAALATAELRGRALVHCSATSGREALDAATSSGADLGALHPLQALAGARSAPRLRGAAFVVDASGPLEAALLSMVRDLGGQLIDVPPEGRALYHAAAVLAGNAPLALLARATALLEQVGIERQTASRALTALMAGAVDNVAGADPAAVLTGPVVRGDAATVARHLDSLAGEPTTQELYRLLALEMLDLAAPAERAALADVLVEPRRHGRGPAALAVRPRVA